MNDPNLIEVGVTWPLYTRPTSRPHAATAQHDWHWCMAHLSSEHQKDHPRDDFPIDQAVFELLLDAASLRDHLLPHIDRATHSEFYVLVRAVAFNYAASVLLRAAGYPARPSWGRLQFLFASGVLNPDGTESGTMSIFGHPNGYEPLVVIGSTPVMGSLGYTRDDVLKDQILIAADSSKYVSKCPHAGFPSIYIVGCVANRMVSVTPEGTHTATADFYEAMDATNIKPMLNYLLMPRRDAIASGQVFAAHE